MVEGREAVGREGGVRISGVKHAVESLRPLLAFAFARASRYPHSPRTTRPAAITLVVPYPPGGGVDAMARIVADKLSAALGQQVVVDNRGGGGGLVGTRAVHQGRARRLHAAPRPHRLDLDQSEPLCQCGLRSAQGFRRHRADRLDAGGADRASVVSGEDRSADVIALARKEPGKLNIGTSAVGTGGYMSAELFKSVTGIDVAIIPYKGTAAVMNDLLGGHVPVAFGVHPAGARQHPGRHAARDRGREPDADCAAARRADLRRVRHAGLRVRAALRPARARRHAARRSSTGSMPSCASSSPTTR